MAEAKNYFQLHIEPNAPIKVDDLTSALGALSRQYQIFAFDAGYSTKAADAQLLVSSVSRGSVDIAFIPDLVSGGMTVLPLLIERVELIQKYVGYLQKLLSWFQGSGEKPKEISIRDCDDAINIARPIAETGGTQNFNIINGDVTQFVFRTTASGARDIIEAASRQKAALLLPDSNRRERVSMVWHRLARDAAKTEGSRSPDQGKIEEIDPKPHAVLFTDDMAYLKKELIDDEDNPYQNVYFVDVEISKVGGKVVAYRISGFHGKENFTA